MGRYGTREEGKKVLELRKQGLTIAKIATILGRSEYFVYKRISMYNKTGKEFNPKDRYGENIEELERKTIELYNSGISARRICKEIHKSYDFVNRVINDYFDNK